MIFVERIVVPDKSGFQIFAETKLKRKSSSSIASQYMQYNTDWFSIIYCLIYDNMELFVVKFKARDIKISDWATKFNFANF